jgi:hypothetical protein
MDEHPPGGVAGMLVHQLAEHRSAAVRVTGAEPFCPGVEDGRFGIRGNSLVPDRGEDSFGEPPLAGVGHRRPELRGEPVQLLEQGRHADAGRVQPVRRVEEAQVVADGVQAVRGEPPEVDLPGRHMGHEQLVDIAAAPVGRVRPVEVVRAALQQNHDPVTPLPASLVSRHDPGRRRPFGELVNQTLLQAERHRPTLLGD